jgi:hypothetical protein
MTERKFLLTTIGPSGSVYDYECTYEELCNDYSKVAPLFVGYNVQSVEITHDTGVKLKYERIS